MSECIKKFITRGYSTKWGTNRPVFSQKVEYMGYDQHADEVERVCRQAWPMLDVRTYVLRMQKCCDGKERPYITRWRY